MTNRRTAWNEVALGVVYTAVLYASFVHDIFRIAGPLHDCVIGYDSHHVLDRLYSGAQGDAYWLPLAPYYHSQFGLQGMVLSALAQQSHADLFVFSTAAACGLALVLCAGLAAFFVAAGRWLGRLSGHIAAGLMSCS